ncbi:MAG: ATP-binding protein [Thermomicrobiales bacterium]
MASNPWAAAARSTPHELRDIPLFAALADGDLRLLAARSSELRLNQGDILFREGEKADAFHIVLEGELRITKMVEGRETEIDLVGEGNFTGDIGLLVGLPHVATARAIRPTRLLVFSGDAFRALITELPEVAGEVLPLLSARVEGAATLIREREKLAALGKISAGLAHELNNPAAAVRRAADQLASTLAAQESRSLRLGAFALTTDQIAALDSIQQSLPTDGKTLDPVSRSDREDEVAFFLEDQGIVDAWDLAPGLVDAGFDRAAVERIAVSLPPAAIADAIGWVASNLTLRELASEIRRGAERISELVQAVKNYSFMDRGPVQEVDVREGLDSTLIILKHKLANVKVSRDYDPDLPTIAGHGSELNQVWTNLIDNAIDAMGGEGTLHVRAAATSDGVEVEIADTGPGVPLAVQERIFRPFFTTKRQGAGTGMGLDIVYRIVVNRHGGTIRLASEPGDTRFVVRLPSTPPLDHATADGGGG